VDAVLGLSMTPTTVGLVLVEGDRVGGATMGHDAFQVHRGGFRPVTTSEYVAEALSRTRAIADGQTLQSIGMTWSDDASIEASLLLDSLADSGFRNVVPIRLPEATEAFARSIGEVIGSEVTAVCVVEPEAVVLLIVDSYDHVAQTDVTDTLKTDQDLIAWVCDVLDRDNRQPRGLVLLGSGSGFEPIARSLEAVLEIPVFAPAEAELALARGAALASANGIDPFGDSPWTPPAPSRKPRLPLAQLGPIAMLVGGVVTFVVSASIAVGIELLPDRAVAEPERSAVITTAGTPAMRPAGIPAAPAPAPAAPPVPALEEAPLLAPSPEAMVDRAPEIAMTEEPVAEAPIEQPAAAPVEPAAAPVDPAAAPPAATEPTVPSVEEAKPSLRTRILQRIAGLHADPQPAE